jgi:transposase-like protein
MGMTVVFGMVERKGRVIAKVVPNTQRATLLPHVIERTMPTSTVFTDEYVSYNPLERMGYEHKRVHHSTKVCVSGDAHVNTIEGFWSLTKNGIRGVYHNVGAHYLQSYLDEYAFRSIAVRALDDTTCSGHSLIGSKRWFEISHSRCFLSFPRGLRQIVEKLPACDHWNLNSVFWIGRERFLCFFLSEIRRCHWLLFL